MAVHGGASAGVELMCRMGNMRKAVVIAGLAMVLMSGSAEARTHCAWKHDVWGGTHHLCWRTHPRKHHHYRVAKRHHRHIVRRIPGPPTPPPSGIRRGSTVAAVHGGPLPLPKPRLPMD